MPIPAGNRRERVNKEDFIVEAKSGTEAQNEDHGIADGSLAAAFSSSS
jgi:hypothetical protein